MEESALRSQIAVNFMGKRDVYWSDWKMRIAANMDASRWVEVGIDELAAFIMGLGAFGGEPAVPTTPELSMEEWRVISESLKAAGQTTLANRIDVWRI